MTNFKPPGAKEIVMQDCLFDGVGLELKNVEKFYANNLVFNNSLTPFDLEGIKSGHVAGTRIYNDPKTNAGNRKNTGWRRPEGPPLPIFCPECKSISTSNNYVFGGMFFLCWDNKEACPICGHEGALLSEGLFNLAGDIAQALSAPDMTHAMFAAIADVANRIVTGATPSEAAVAEIEKISPELSSVLKRAAEFCKSALIYGASIAGIIALYYAKQSVDLAREQLALSREEAGAPQIVPRDKAVEQILNAIAGSRFTSKTGTKDEPPEEPAHKAHTPRPPKSKPPLKRGAS